MIKNMHQVKCKSFQFRTGHRNLHIKQYIKEILTKIRTEEEYLRLWTTSFLTFFTNSQDCHPTLSPTQNYTHNLVSNKSWHCTWRWRTRRGAALSRDTINDCDPGSSKNKYCFSIPPLLPRWMMNPGEEVQCCGINIHQGPERHTKSGVPVHLLF